MRKTEGSVRFAQDLDAIIAAAKFDGGSKAVFVQTWPGMYSATGFTPRGKTPAHVYPSYPGAKTLLLSVRLFCVAKQDHLPRQARDKCCQEN